MKRRPGSVPAIIVVTARYEWLLLLLRCRNNVTFRNKYPYAENGLRPVKGCGHLYFIVTRWFFYRIKYSAEQIIISTRYKLVQCIQKKNACTEYSPSDTKTVVSGMMYYIIFSYQGEKKKKWKNTGIMWRESDFG